MSLIQLSGASSAQDLPQLSLRLLNYSSAFRLFFFHFFFFLYPPHPHCLPNLIQAATRPQRLAWTGLGIWGSFIYFLQFWDPQFSSVTQSCPTLCNPMECSMPGFPVHHQLPEFAEIHVHWVGDAIQWSHPLSSSEVSKLTFQLCS